MATCKSCNAEIIFVMSGKTGKMSPLDAQPVEDGNLVILGGAFRSASPEDRRLHRPLYKSHFATCADASRYRSK